MVLRFKMNKNPPNNNARKQRHKEKNKNNLQLFEEHKLLITILQKRYVFKE